MHTKTLIALAASLLAAQAHAVDSFDASNSTLTLENVTVGATAYRNVAAKITAYTVTISGKVNGAAFNKTFTYKTGALIPDSLT